MSTQVSKIIALVAAYYGYGSKELLARGREQPRVMCRMVAMYLAGLVPGIGDRELVAAFGFHRSMFREAHARVTEQVGVDRVLAADVAWLLGAGVRPALAGRRPPVNFRLAYGRQHFRVSNGCRAGQPVARWRQCECGDMFRVTNVNTAHKGCPKCRNLNERVDEFGAQVAGRPEVARVAADGFTNWVGDWLRSERMRERRHWRGRFLALRESAKVSQF